MLQRASYEYAPSNPDGYRSGVIHISKAIGARALAVKVFEMPSATHTVDFVFTCPARSAPASP